MQKDASKSRRIKIILQKFASVIIRSSTKEDIRFKRCKLEDIIEGMKNQNRADMQLNILEWLT